MNVPEVVAEEKSDGEHADDEQAKPDSVYHRLYDENKDLKQRR